MPASLHTVSRQAVQAIRLAKALSMAEVAERSRLGRTTVWKIETGVVTPRMSTLRALAKGLGVPVSALLSNEDAA